MQQRKLLQQRNLLQQRKLTALQLDQVQTEDQYNKMWHKAQVVTV